jgi:hypothetical protein
MGHANVERPVIADKTAKTSHRHAHEKAVPGEGHGVIASASGVADLSRRRASG